MSKRKRSDDIDASSSDAESQSRDFQDFEEEEEEFVTLTGASGEKITPETGQIVSVEAEDFMCHKKFSIKFNRNINFVTGANGSGKSAIVAAIQLCLGANAKTTGRGSSIRSFIREGSKNGYCVVRVTLWNDGHDAYRPDLYSHKITVERRIAKNGVSNYKISSASGKVIATTPKEIGNILKTFNIFVDNPCCLLTQEASKQFIQGSQHAKYEFFLKATGLARTKDELTEAVRRIKDSNAQCEVTEEKLMAQKGNLDKLERELEDLRALDRVESQVAEYEAKMHWFDVYALEAVYEDEEARLVELQQRLAEATDRQADMARKVAEMGTVESISADSLALETQQQEIQRQHQQVVRGQSARESSYRQLEEEARELVRSRAEHVKRLAEVEKEIATMQRKALENSEGKVERVREQALQADE
jgi:structural maintenance of chromosomes protein 6